MCRGARCDSARIDYHRMNMPDAVVTYSVEEGIGLLRLGAPTEKIVVLDEGRIAALEAQLSAIVSQPADLPGGKLKGLIIAGASPSGFCAGADVGAIERVTDPAVGEAKAQHYRRGLDGMGPGRGP